MSNEQTCSADDYRNADANSSSSFSSARDAGSSTQSCPDQGRKTHPCDIQDVVLFEVGSVTRTYEHENGEWIEKPTPTSARKVSVRGAHGAPITDRLDVFGQRSDARAPTRIDIEVSIYRVHESSEHPLLLWDPPGPGGKQVRRVGVDQVEVCSFPVWRKSYGEETQAGRGASSLLDRYWPFRVGVNEFKLLVETCGVRNSGRPVGSKRFTVRVYPSDQYKLSVSIPAWKSKKWETGGAVRYRRGDEELPRGLGTERTKSSEHLDGRKEESTRFTPSGQPWAPTTKSAESSKGGDRLETTDRFGEDPEISFTPKFTEPSELTFELKLNDEKVGGATVETARKIIKNLHKVQEAWNDVLKLLHNWSPPGVGFKVAGELSFFSGGVYATWGYKECKEDAQIRYRVGYGSNLKLVSAGVTLSFGFQSPADLVKATLNGSIEGTISFEQTNELLWNSDGSLFQQAPAGAGLKGDVKFDLYGEACVGIPGLRYDRRAGFATAFEAEAAIEVGSSKPFKVTGSANVKALVFYTIVEDPTSGAERKEYELTDERPMGHFEVPS